MPEILNLENLENLENLDDDDFQDSRFKIFIIISRLKVVRRGR